MDSKGGEEKELPLVQGVCVCREKRFAVRRRTKNEDEKEIFFFFF